MFAYYPNRDPSFSQFVFKFRQINKVPHGNILNKNVATVTKNRGMCNIITHTEFVFPWKCFYPVVHPSSHGEGGVAPLPGCPIYSDAARYTCLNQNGYGLKFLIRTNIWLISTSLMSMVIHGCCFLFFTGVGEPLPSALLLHNAPTQGKQ